MQSRVASPVAKVLRVISAVICLIVIAAFVIFAVEQTQGASNHQQDVLNGTAPAEGSVPPNAGPAGSSSTKSGSSSEKQAPKGSVHKAIDEASEQLTSPFSGLTSKSDSVWLQESVNLVLALIVYGFGLGYVARLLRVRV